MATQANSPANSQVNSGSFQFSLPEGSTPKEIVTSFRNAMLSRMDAAETLPLYSREVALFSCVKNGDTTALKKLLFEMDSQTAITTGKMSRDPVRQAQFMVVSGITLATRYSIAGGLSEPMAYSLSDAYLQRLDSSTNEAQAIELFLTALFDFTRRVNEVRKRGTYSLTVTKCVRYIGDHLYKKLTLTLLADKCGVTPQYLSSAFHKETGLTVTEYIKKEKLAIAAQMLEFTGFSVNRISTVLEFPDQSAFTEAFRKQYGVTPTRYRKS